MMNNNLKNMLVGVLLVVGCLQTMALDVNYKLSLKKTGDHLTAAKPLPLALQSRLTKDGDDMRLVVTLTARERVYFNIGVSVPTDYQTDNCEFYLPGFWYHKNLRSPKEAPSFHTSKSWNFREDRLSSPLTGVIDLQSGRSLTVMRVLDTPAEALNVKIGEAESRGAGRQRVGNAGKHGSDCGHFGRNALDAVDDLTVAADENEVRASAHYLHCEGQSLMVAQLIHSVEIEAQYALAAVLPDADESAGTQPLSH